MKLKIIRIKSKYWKPRKDVQNLYKKIYKKVHRFVNRHSIVFISEKALLVACGLIYDEGLIKVRFVDILNVKIFKTFWCSIFRRFLRDFIFESLCLVKDEDLARHIHLCSSLFNFNILSLLKPVSTYGVDASLLPYLYVTYPNPNNYGIVIDIVNRLSDKLRCLGVCVIDSDVSLIHKKFKIVLTSRPVYIKNCINLGILTYLLSKSPFRKFFIRCPTVTYAVSKLGVHYLFSMGRIVEKYIKSIPVRTVIETYRYVGATSYTDITWSQLCKLIPHYPVVIIRLV